MPMDIRPLRTALIVASFIVGVSFVATAAVVGDTFYRVKSLGNTISVTGSAERTIVSDTAKWTARVTRSAALDGVKEASAALRADVARTVDLLHAGGVKDEQITVQPMNVYPNYSGNEGRYGAGTLIGYTLDQRIIVESSDVKGVTSLAQDVPSKLLQGGAIASTDSLEYYYSKLGDLKLEMLAEATKNARDRALRIVGSTGSSLGQLQSAGMGVFQVTSVNSTEISDYGAYDTSTIQKKVTSVVRASFLVGAPSNGDR